MTDDDRHRSRGAPRARRHRAALHRPRGDPGRDRDGARRHVSRGDRRADEGARPVRDHDPRGVRRPRARSPHLHRCRRGARVRLDVAVGRRQHAHDRRAPDRAPRHRGAEAALAAADGDRRAARVPVAVGGRRGQRHAQPLVPGRARRRRVRRHRHEDVGDERRAGRHRRARGAHRRRHLLPHRREGARSDASAASR